MCIRDRNKVHPFLLYCKVSSTLMKLFVTNKTIQTSILFPICVHPVSYTHLDVYKRQGYGIIHSSVLPFRHLLKELKTNSVCCCYNAGLNWQTVVILPASLNLYQFIYSLSINLYSICKLCTYFMLCNINFFVQ